MPHDQDHSTGERKLLDRFTIQEQLGAGAFGTVYSAYDGKFQRNVAVKHLAHPDPAQIYRFKKEFRLLAGMSHRNLVCLYDLFGHDGAFYFSMELVHGVPLNAYVRAGLDGGRSSPHAPSFDATVRMSADADEAAMFAAIDGGTRKAGTEAGPMPSLARVRAVFAQLSDALEALHGAGMVHRDLKPSNVLVTAEGRVVVLDFGLVADSEADATRTEKRSVVGTPLYMAPEQASGSPADVRSDWYAVGVMLYEALTGVAPYDTHNLAATIFQKIHGNITPPRSLVPDIPQELSDLTVALLSPDPGKRPIGADFRRALAPEASSDERHSVEEARSRSGRLFGREAELSLLEAAYRNAAEDGPELVLVEGESGIGKSALCEHFFASLRRTDRPLLFRARCYEHDALPYKVLDGIVDELSAALRKLPDRTITALIDPDVQELARVFPVLHQVPAIARQRMMASASTDPQEARRKAVAALTHLLTKLDARRAIVLYVDDVQWGDTESLAFLESLLDRKESRRLLVVLAYRREEKESSAFLRTLLRTLERSERVRRSTVSVDRLDDLDANALVRTMLSTEELPDEWVARIVEEADGHPLFLEELVRYVKSVGNISGDASSALEISSEVLLLSDVVGRRVDALPPTARRLLDAIALASVPLPLTVAFTAAGESHADQALLLRLTADHLVRTTTHGHEELVAPYHDRIRETLADRLRPEARRKLHLDLARALETYPGIPANQLVAHFEGAGDLRSAAVHALRAARLAAESLAFHEAAEHYARVLAWTSQDDAERASIVREHADALLNEGRCVEAGRAYLIAAESCAPSDRTSLKSAAAQSLILGGNHREGGPLMRELLADVGLPYPKTTWGARLRLATRLFLLALTPIRVERLMSKTADPETIQRMDICYAASRTLQMHDATRAIGYSLEAVRLSLRARDGTRVVEGLAMYAATASMLGLRRAPFLIQATFELAERNQNDFGMGLAHYARGMDFFNRLWFRESLGHFRRSVEFLRRCSGVTPLRQNSEISELMALRFLEDVEELEEKSNEAIRSARQVGNPYVEAISSLDSCTARLAADDVAGARERIAHALEIAAEDDLYLVFAALTFQVRCDRYEGKWEDALDRIEGSWSALKRVGMLAVPVGRGVYTGLLIGSKLAVAAHDASRRAELLASARSALRQFPRSDAQYVQGYRALLEGAIASLSGDAERAAQLCDRAAVVLEEGRMLPLAAAAKKRAAQQRGDAVAETEADDWLGRLGVRAPDAWADGVAPGFLPRA